MKNAIVEDNYRKVLFVSSGNILRFGISPIVLNQGKSLENIGINVTYYGIEGRGLLNYLGNVRKLKAFIKSNNFDLIHAHYSLSGIVTTLSNTRLPIVVSLMGSDSEANFFLKWIIRIFSFISWKEVIVKSMNIKANLNLKKANIIPNGVNFNMFKEIPKQEAKARLGLSPEQKYIAFIANPNRLEKNYDLAKQSVVVLSKEDRSVVLNVVFGKDGIEHDMIPYYINASDVLILTSTREGSPNVVKEAMACNCPVVSTNVGDVSKILKDADNCYVTSFDPTEIASKLRMAIDNGRTNGRKKIEHLSDITIAKKIEHLYNNMKLDI